MATLKQRFSPFKLLLLIMEILPSVIKFLENGEQAALVIGVDPKNPTNVVISGKAIQLGPSNSMSRKADSEIVPLEAPIVRKRNATFPKGKVLDVPISKIVNDSNIRDHLMRLHRRMAVRRWELF